MQLEAAQCQRGQAGVLPPPWGGNGNAAAEKAAYSPHIFTGPTGSRLFAALLFFLLLSWGGDVVKWY